MSQRLSLLVDLASLLAREVDLDALLAAACERMAEALRAERASVWLVDADTSELVTRVAMLPELPELRLAPGTGIAGHVAQTGDVVRLDDAHADPRFDPSVERRTGYRTRSMLVAPLREDTQSPVRGVVQILNHVGGAFDEDDERYVVALATQLARALALTTLRAQNVEGPGVTLRGPFNRIVGRSKPLQAVYERIALAAQTTATVLLRGETGTGKGLFARAIHVNSARQAKPFVTVDCTTLPSSLAESELFGHERGAFTGADRRVIGKVELAAGGTVFLDEIAELPPESQGKLLRFLQERTFERVGGRTTLAADVRIVAATHRPLERLVAEGRFREDLYFRLRVVEITLPPLRDRGGDEIEALARHFAAVYAERYGRPAPTFTDDALAVLRAHAWPGNVRELEHWVESALVLAPDGCIRRGLGPLAPPSMRERGWAPPADANGASLSHRASEGALASGAAGPSVALPLGMSLEEASRRYVEATVTACGGSRSQAATSLGIGRNTVARLLKAR